MDEDRNALEAVARALRDCEWIGAELATGGIAVRHDLRPISGSMIALRGMIHTWLRERPRSPAKETKDWWPAFCKGCGWAGLSRDCDGGEPIADTGDFGEVRCPVCWEVVDDDQRTA